MDGLSTQCPPGRQHLTLLGSNFAHLEGLDFPDVNSSDVALLMGVQVAEWLARRSLTNAARIRFPAGDLIPAP